MRRFIRPAVTLSSFSLLLLAGAGCEEPIIPDNTGAFTPQPTVAITIDQTELDFGTVRADEGATASKNLSLTNTGSADALLRGAYFSANGGNYRLSACTTYEAPSETPTEGVTPTLAVPDVSCDLALPAGQSVTLTVTFAPQQRFTPEECADRATTLALVFNTTDTTFLYVDLTGIGDSDYDDDGSLCYADSDCDDSAGYNSPGGTEVLDDEDNDCDGEADEGLATPTPGTPTPGTPAPGTPTPSTPTPGTPTPDAPTVTP